MASNRNLRPLLKGAVTFVMASSGVSAGCSGVGPGIEDDPGFVSLECGDPQQDLLAGLRPGAEPDYLEVRSIYADGRFETVARSGEACKTAEDREACLSALAAASMAEGFRLGPCSDACAPYSLVATRGDAVSVLGSKEEVEVWLGSIDTPEEAMLLVAMEGIDVRCGDGGAKPTDAGFAVQGFSYEGCDGVNRLLFAVTPEGAVSRQEQVVIKEANSNCVVGRRPVGLTASVARGEAQPVADYLAAAARLEAASVYAFVQIERELAAHRAPRRLLAAARRAAADEVRHARVTARLAHRFGATRLQRPEVVPTAPRDLEGLLLDNAVEGCVRETFGAAVGVWQAKNAGDPNVAKAMRRIAADELRHAALAWDIAAWFEPKLGADALRRIRQARRAAIDELKVELSRPVDANVARALGVPSSENALRLHQELERRVWS